MLRFQLSPVERRQLLKRDDRPRAGAATSASDTNSQSKQSRSTQQLPDSTTAATAAHSPKACSPGAYYTVIVCGCYCLPRSQPLTVNMFGYRVVEGGEKCQLSTARAAGESHAPLPAVADSRPSILHSQCVDHHPTLPTPAHIYPH